MNDQSSSWGTPFVPNHPMIAKSNDVISTTKANCNVATIILNAPVDSNPAVVTNSDAGSIVSELLITSIPVSIKNPEVTDSSIISYPVIDMNHGVCDDQDKYGVCEATEGNTTEKLLELTKSSSLLDQPDVIPVVVSMHSEVDSNANKSEKKKKNNSMVTNITEMVHEPEGGINITSLLQHSATNVSDKIQSNMNNLKDSSSSWGTPLLSNISQQSVTNETIAEHGK